MRVLHVSTHMGKGVGTVVLPYLEYAANQHEQTLCCFGYMEESEIDFCNHIGVPVHVHMANYWNTLNNLIVRNDVVIVHWWNHPLLYDFFVRSQLPPCRLIFWGHTSGFNPPNSFPVRALGYPDGFIFTTPLSKNVREVKRFKYKEKFETIWSTGGCERLNWIQKTPHEGFNVGYIGTTDFTKMHPDFVTMNNNVNIPNVHFPVIGGPVKHPANKKFTFYGYISEAEKWQHLSKFDVFGYPLAPHHYGTCDQALQEAMAVGIVPVVMANPMECLMVKDGVTGLIATNQLEYMLAIETLYKDNELRGRLSANAREYAAKAFSLEYMASQWDRVLATAIDLPRTPKKWKPNAKPFEVFLESLGRFGKPFKQNDKTELKRLATKPNWQSQTKGTAHHYHNYFPNDKTLAYWSGLMRRV